MWVAIGLSLVCALLVLPERWSRRIKRGPGQRAPLFKGTGAHWQRNYGRRSFLRLGGATLLAGVLAYSGADEIAEDFHAGSVRSAASDRLAHVFKVFGERFWFANWMLVAAIDAWWQSGAVSRWGRANFEAMVVGLPLLWTVQRGLGANRPSSDDGSPHWRPMAAPNSASGHTFIAAVPWLTLAMRLSNGAAVGLSRIASWATGWSRLNDRKHYVSQIILGWTIAYNAVVAVNEPTLPSEESKSS